MQNSGKAAVAVVLLLATTTSGAVIGIDFGARFLKVGIIRPGTGIEMVLNEATQRKSSSSAGFTALEERVYGNEAQNMLGKVPERIFIMSKLLLGQTLDSEAITDFKRYLYPYKFETDEATNAAIVRYNANSTYRAEEMVAFVLTYAKQIAEGHAGITVKDCVITVPHFFGHTERIALINSAAIAGLNVLSLLHESTAFAFKYGFDKESEFSAEPTNVVFLDLGASSYKVSVVSFSATVGKKNKTLGAMQVRGLGWDATLGGKDFDDIVLNLIAAEFNEKQLKGKDEVRQDSKAVGKLRKAAESTKDILSANTQYQMGIEALYKDLDLRMVLSRTEFNAEAERRGLWKRLVPPLEEALTMANLTKEEIHSVEVVGGATRIPQVKQAAMDFFERKQLGGALNGDEAAAFGATLFAAKLSTSFRLREFTVNDVYPYATSIKIIGQGDDSADDGTTDDDAEGGGSSKKGKDKLLFKAYTKMPHKKLITMTRTDDLVATLSLGEPTNVEGLSPIASFNITGVASAYARLLKDETRTVMGKPKVSVTFALSTSGLIDVSKAEMAIEMLEKYDDFEMVPDPNATTNATDAAADDAGTAAAKDEDAAATDDASSPSAATNASAASNLTNATAMIKVKVEKERKRLHYVTLKTVKTVLGKCTPISQEIISSCIARNVELLKAEQLRKTNAEAKNSLESFIIDTRDKLQEEGVAEVSTEEEREALRVQFDETEEWLYGDGVSVDAATYTKRQKSMQVLTQPIFSRFSELKARPEAVTKAREAVNWTLTILQTWATERPEVTEQERAKVEGMCTNFTSWLDDVEAKQAGLTLTDPPAFLSSAVASKLEVIELEVRKLIKKPKPKPPKVKPNATSTNETETNGTASDGASSAGTGAGDASDGDATAQGDEELPAHDEL